jgi:hypothetical protein
MSGLVPPDYRIAPRSGATLPQPPLVTVTAMGQSRRTFEFQIDPIGTAYYSRPGVYMFLRKTQEGKWFICYIGETSDFNCRLNTDLRLHHRWQSICAERATHIGTLHVPGDPVLRETIETDLIRAYETPCNRQ